MLGVLLLAPRGPFYSPKVARSRWRSTWKANHAFCRVVHRTGAVAVWCSIPFLFWRIRLLGRWSRWRTRQSGVPNRPLARATRRPLIALVTVGSGGYDPPDSPVNFSRGAFWSSRER
jgi:ribosomal protein L36